MPRRRRRAAFTCPVCGAAVAAGAPVCRECGSDESTGWSEDTLYDGLDLPDPGYGTGEPAPRRDAIATKELGALLIVIFVVLIVIGLFS